jgi:4-hydroxy-2-oxoheptanedioate aldolase
MVVSGCSRVVGLAHGSDSGVPRTAVAELEATLAEDGVDGIYVGPRDLSYSLGCPHDPVLKPALERIRSACAAAGKPAGIHASDGTTARRYRDGG